MKVLAVDPGLTVGLAWYDTGRRYFKSWQEERFKATEYVAYLCEQRAMELVVCESFTPRGGRMTNQPDALETIGAIRWLCRQARIPFELQSPSAAKGFSSNDKLRTIGWKNPTIGGHADDAARHLLLAVVRHDLYDPVVFTRSS